MTTPPTREEILEVAAAIRPGIEHIAEINNWTINPDTGIADSVIEGLARNKIVRGKKYCPCRLPSGDEEKDRQYLCPCRNSKAEIAADGHCHCYLYLKE